MYKLQSLLLRLVHVCLYLVSRLWSAIYDTDQRSRGPHLIRIPASRRAWKNSRWPESVAVSAKRISGIVETLIAERGLGRYLVGVDTPGSFSSLRRRCRHRSLLRVLLSELRNLQRTYVCGTDAHEKVERGRWSVVAVTYRTFVTKNE